MCILVILILFFFAGPAGAQEALDSSSMEALGSSSQEVSDSSPWGYKAPRGELRLMWYNVENLFHPSVADGPPVADDEFTPEGVRGWSYWRYRQKLTRVARVIVAAGQWTPPDVIGLCEVEGAQVLEDLVSHPILAPYEYSYLHREGPDHRGMDVACLFRGERFNPVSWQFISPVEGEGFDQTREILHAKGVWGRKDTLELFLVHFISRYRGSGITANYRRRQSACLAGLIDSVLFATPGNLVVAAGDFNDNREAWSMEPLRPGERETTFCVIPQGIGASYKYRGAWSGIDLWLVSGRMERYRIQGVVFKHPSLLVPDLTYGGVKPFRTYDGYRYAGGYSDHLPVLLDISPLPFSWGFGR